MLIRMLDMYGATELEAALNEAIATGSLHSSSIQQILEKRRIARGAAPPVLLRFANDKRINELILYRNHLIYMTNYLTTRRSNERITRKGKKAGIKNCCC